MEKIFGIDISEFQTNINLTKAKEEGIKYAILRGGFTGYGKSKGKAIDSAFLKHYNTCKKLGIPVGCYWFSRAVSKEEGEAEAKYFYDNCLKGKQFEYPVAIDVEDSYYQSKASKEAVTQAIIGFCEYLENKGYYVVIYANTDWFKNKMNLNNLNAYDKWVAYWGTQKPTNISAGIWQFGGSTNKVRTNKVAGIVCDQDYAYKDYPSLIKNKGLNGYSISKEEPNIPSTAKKTIEQLALEVIDGLWGNGKDRVEKLTQSGYNYDDVQNRVNEIMNSRNENIKYTVKKGDTLTSIAKKYNTTWQKIYNDNKSIIGSNPNLIKVGQVLIIK